MNVYDNNQQIVMRISREFKCCSGAWCCISSCSSCAYETVIEAPVGQVIGRAKQLQSCWPFTKFQVGVYDEMDQKTLHIDSEYCVCSGPCCTSGSEFTILSSDQTSEIGKIKRPYRGCAAECFTNADRF